jgi:hypothetical protein
MQRSGGNQAVQRMLRRRSAPDLRGAVEALSGVNVDDVQVHRGSPKPAELGALAYAQGGEVHLGPDQDRHLAHELWHVAQQRQRRVSADAQFMGRAVSTDPSLEREAEVMGEAATRLARGPAATGPDIAVDRPMARTGAPAVLQAKWADLTEPVEQRIAGAENFREKLDRLAQTVGADPDLLERYQGLEELYKLAGSDLVAQVEGNLNIMHDDETPHRTNDLLKWVIDHVSPIARAGAADGVVGDDDENDHPEGNLQRNPELDIEPEDVKPSELEDEPALLREIFIYLTRREGGQYANQKYEQWRARGPMTRAQFRHLLGVQAPNTASHQNRLHMKRTPFTQSGPKDYMTSAHGQFTGVRYLTDHNANIDFQHPNAKVKWKNPVLPASDVDLDKGCATPGYGFMNYQKKVKLVGAHREQHNAIANRLKPNLKALEATSYTWHHLSKEYKMVLVDYVAHYKHGHNGGFLFWQ